MPHQSVTPAKTRPAPTRALRPKKRGWTKCPRLTPKSTRLPAATRTWRSNAHGAQTSFSTDNFALDQACIPPVILATSAQPSRVSWSRARALRCPLWQTNTTGVLRSSSCCRVVSSANGKCLAPTIRPPANSQPLRTSTICITPPSRRRTLSAATVTSEGSGASVVFIYV